MSEPFWHSSSTARHRRSRISSSLSAGTVMPTAAAVEAKLEESYHGESFIAVSGKGWHEGVKGIVASRIVNRFHVPAILFSITDGIAKGSGRSVGSVPCDPRRSGAESPRRAGNRRRYPRS